MRMEAGLVESGRDMVRHVTRVGYVRKVIRKTKRTRRIVRPPQAVSMALQDLFMSCLDMFKGPGTVPSHQDVQKLSHIIDNMKPEDVGLSGELQFFNPSNGVQRDPRVTCTTIYKCDNFLLCIFFLPANGVIPFHNHPGMTVFSKLLLGTMHIKSYDWVDPVVHSDSSMSSSQLRLAKLKADRVFTAPCDTSVLYPTTGGNIHAFTAITPSAVLDVMGPPYSNDDGRDCSFYKDHPYSASTEGETTVKMEDADCYGWLEEIEMPENSKMDGIEYLGPQVIEP